MPLPDGRAGRLDDFGVDRDGGPGATWGMLTSRCYAAWEFACVELQTDDDPSTTLAGLYVRVDEVARRPRDVVMYQSGGIYVHSARLEGRANSDGMV